MGEKVYLAGPGVFRTNARAFAEGEKETARKYGFEPLYPLDNEIEDFQNNPGTAMRIFDANIAMIEKADLVVADCSPFRGLGVDDGTALEVGFALGKRKPCFGHIEEMITTLERARLSGEFLPYKDGSLVDRNGFLMEDFGLPHNLMIPCSFLKFGGRMIQGTLDNCFRVVRGEIESGRLKISGY